MPHRDFSALPPLFGRHLNLLTALLLMVLAWALYLPTMHYDFVYYDDVRILKIHPELYGQATVGGDMKAIFETNFPREEPLLVRDMTWALDSRIFGFGNPLGYHLVNVLLYGLVAGLLFIVLVHSTRRYRVPVLTTVAFLLLAVHVEPVAWIMGRKDLLSALFMLLALYTQIRRLTAHHRLVEHAWYALTLLFFVAGLFSKINVLTFPLVLFLHAIFFPYLRHEVGPDETFWKDRDWSKEIALLVPGLAISGGVYLWYQNNLAQMGIFDRGYTAQGLDHLFNLLMVNPLVFWLDLRQIFWPLHPVVLYPWPDLQPAYPPWQMAVAGVTLAGLLAFGLWLFCRRKDLFFYYAAFFVLMVPYLNLIYIGIWVADRYLYFSSFCVLALAISLGETVWRRSKRPARFAIVAVGMGLMAENLYQTVAYEPAWRNAETLWQYHIAQSQRTAADYSNLAAFYYADFSDARTRQEKLHAATDLQKMTVVIDAGLADFWRDREQTPPPATYFLFFLRSLVEQVENKPDAALASLLMADRLHPKFDSTNLNLYLLYCQMAASAKDPQHRATYLLAARDRYAEYIRLEYHDRPPPADVRAEMDGLQVECSKLTQPTQRADH